MPVYKTKIHSELDRTVALQVIFTKQQVSLGNKVSTYKIYKTLFKTSAAEILALHKTNQACSC